MITQAVVLAAGMGSRIRSEASDHPKPLQLVDGVPLLKRTVLTLAKVGIRKVFIVVGFRQDQVRDHVQADLDYHRAGISIEFIENLDYEKSNGLSVLAARGRVQGPFLLSMCDHVYEPEIPALASYADMAKADLHLCVDLRLPEIYDMDDCTKVLTKAGRIVDIGKKINDFDCVDCGVFAVGPRLLECLSAVYAEKGDCSLSDGVKRLSAMGRARVIDIGDAFWQDVDTPEAKVRAEEIIRRPAEIAVPVRLVAAV